MKIEQKNNLIADITSFKEDLLSKYSININCIRISDTPLISLITKWDTITGDLSELSLHLIKDLTFKGRGQELVYEPYDFRLLKKEHFSYLGIDDELIGVLKESFLDNDKLSSENKFFGKLFKLNGSRFELHISYGEFETLIDFSNDDKSDYDNLNNFFNGRQSTKANVLIYQLIINMLDYTQSMCFENNFAYLNN